MGSLIKSKCRRPMDQLRKSWILVFAWWLQGTTAQDNFYFQPQPQDQSVIQGQSITLECSVSNTRHIMFYWTLNNNKVQNTTRRYQNGSNLVITRVDRLHDLGEFRCIATNATTGISLTSQGAQLDILWIGEIAKVQLQSPESEKDLVEGIELVLRCKAEGNPEIRLEWFHNGARVFRNERISFRNKRLYISGVTPADNGIYSCKAINEAGVIESTENFALRLPSDTAARIVQLPQDIVVKDGGSASFDCVYENAAATEWYAPEQDVPISNSSKYTVFPNGTLLVAQVSNEDRGLYRCVGISSLSKDAPQQTYVASIKIAYLQDILEKSFEPRVSSDQLNVVPRNGQFEVTCKSPGGHPKPHMWWEDSNGHVISDTGRVRVDDMRLIIDGAKKSDSGNYTCVAENLAGETRHAIGVYVAIAPSITGDPVTTLVDEGEMAVMTCDYLGSPHPVTTVRWLKDEKYVKETGSHYTVHSHNGTLIIKNVILSDGGAYVCEVNTTGFPPIRSQSASLLVKEKLKFSPLPVSKKVELGSNAKIYCKARGSSKPTVRWIKSGPHLLSQWPPQIQNENGTLHINGHLLSEWPPHIHDENGTLHISGVQHEDAGKYICIATSPQGIINATIQVDVIVMPKFTVEPTNTEAYEGYPTMLHCMAIGDPPPTIQWDKNNMLNGFDQKRFQVMQNGTLHISEVHMDDEGKYGCTAGNSGGFRRVEVSLIVRSAENYSPNLFGRGHSNPEESTMTKTVAITLGAAAIYIVLVMGLMIWCRFRRARRKALLLAQATADVAKSENGDINVETEMHDKDGRQGNKEPGAITKSDGEGQSHSSGSHSHHSKRSRSSYDKLQFPRQDLQTMMLLGQGEYGDVFLAKAKGIRDGETETIVMVKALHTRDENAHFEYKREMDMYHKINHNNVIKLLGVCRDVEPFLMVLEYSDWGDLKQFLLATRKDNPRKGLRPPPLSLSQIVGICHQVSVGMEHLSNHRFTHKDLATRNCLITSHLDVKISMPSLTRDTYAQEYYQYHNKYVPLRWAPTEAIFEDEWSTKSDVWSFGVLAWEVFHQAELPYADKQDDAILQLLRSQELRLAPPEGAPESLRRLLQCCWNQSPKERPEFAEIVSAIGEVKVDSHV